MVSNAQFFSISNLVGEDSHDDKGLETLPISSDLNVDDYITGSGNDQDVRIYVNNESENLNNNPDFFEIPSVSSDDMYLSYGDFMFSKMIMLFMQKTSYLLITIQDIREFLILMVLQSLDSSVT